MAPVLNEIKAYLETRLKLLNYESAEKAFAVISALIADLVIFTAAMLAFIFITIAMAFYAGSLFHSLWIGFSIVSLLYVTIVIIGHLFKPFFQNRLIKLLIRRLIHKTKKS